jgi:hypothetical protein
VTISLALSLLAFVPETASHRQLRELERRLLQFPPEDVVRDNLAFGNRHLEWLQVASAIVPAHRREAMAAHVAEAERLYGVWCCLFRANIQIAEVKRLVAMGRKDNGSPMNKYFPQTVEKLLTLAESWIDDLESSLGDEAFRAGRMPPAVPYWRFQWID